MPRPPHGHGPVVGDKPKHFKATLGKLLRYMKSSMPLMIFSFLLAIASVVLTLNVPNISGEATDTLIIGVVQKQVYKTLEQQLPQGRGVDTMDEAVEPLAAACG